MIYFKSGPSLLVPVEGAIDMKKIISEYTINDYSSISACVSYIKLVFLKRTIDEFMVYIEYDPHCCFDYGIRGQIQNTRFHIRRTIVCIIFIW